MSFSSISSACDTTNPFVPSQDQGGPSAQQTYFIRVPSTEAQLTARSKLRELKVEAEQRLLSATSKAPQFVAISTPHPDPVTSDGFSNYATRQARKERELHQGAAYLTRLIDVAYPIKIARPSYAQKINEIRGRFQNYLNSQEEESAPKKVNQISSQALNNVLRDLHVARLEEELHLAREQHKAWTLSLEERELFSISLDLTKNKPLPERYEVPRFLDQFEKTPKSFLKNQQIALGAELDKGGFAKVYSVSSLEEKFPNDKYVLKWVEREAIQDPQIQFWRQQEFAPARLNGIPNVVRTLFFMVSVKTPNQSQKHYLLPADELKLFGLHLPEGAIITLRGQLMERAPGSSADSLVKKALKKGLQGLPANEVLKIARDLFETLSAMHAHNIVHGDLHLGNIFYDPDSGKVTVIDFGLAQRFRKKEKDDHRFHRNPLEGNTIGKLELKGDFRSPRAIDKKLHGSETDFFSYATILLGALSPEDFNTAIYRKPVEQRFLFSPNHPLENYLQLIKKETWNNDKGDWSSSSPSTTERILNKNPELKRIIELSFQIAEEREDRARALEELKGILDSIEG